MVRCFLRSFDFGKSNFIFYEISAFCFSPAENQLAPVKFIFLYFRAEIFEFSFNPLWKIG